MDGLGYSYSAELLNKTKKWNGVNFIFGEPNTDNAIKTNNQNIELSPGKYKYIKILAISVNGSSYNKIKIKYTDGDKSIFEQRMSDWYSAENINGEYKAITMNYRNSKMGRDNRTFYLYGYSFNLLNNKIVESIILPNSNSTRILAITLVP